MSRCVIVGGADMGNYGHIRSIRKWNSFRRSLFPFLTAMLIFSLQNISGCARDITIQGAKYPLENGEMCCNG